ncbi:hypothetical protein [uncultured Sunxiuqinia sp.]|uniref:hypothetical protein n=1 Tax=uncultured Sunxiuqinia sp. TaxID=1573825 RepID=UPI002AA77B3D|nr:hypothetical protein [uncultured Sunxiuqinia sp.]
MKTYRIIYGNKIPNVSNRKRVALDLKSLYWKDRELPKDWYWFENNIELKEVLGREYDSVDVILSGKLLDDASSFPPIIMELKRYKNVSAILFLQDNIENNWVTIFSRPY